MVKAQSFFNGSKPSNPGKDSTNRQVGHSSASGNPNNVINTRGHADTNTHAKLSTQHLSRPNIPGKVDNRNIVGGRGK